MDLLNNISQNSILSDHKTKSNLKILIQYCIMLVTSCIMGALFTSFLSEDSILTLTYKTSLHFEFPFLNCRDFSEIVRFVLRYSISDFICFAIIFIFTFSAFHFIVTDLLLVYQGFKAGFSVTLLYYALIGKAAGYSPGILQFLFFTFAKILLLYIFLIYSCRLTAYSFEIRNISETGHAFINQRKLFLSILYTVIYCGIIFLINGIYCWLIYLI